MRPKTKKRLFAIRLASGQSVVDICRELDMSESTGYGWKNNDPYVKEVVDEIINETRQSIVNKITNACSTVVDELEAMATAPLNDPMTDTGLKIRACKLLLESYMKLQEIGDLERKISEIEGLLDVQS